MKPAAQTSSIMLNDHISVKTAQEKKKRRKELLRLYKLRKSNSLEQKNTIGQFKSKQPPQVDAVPNFGGGRSSEIPSENIMDNRAVD